MIGIDSTVTHLARSLRPLTAAASGTGKTNMRSSNDWNASCAGQNGVVSRMTVCYKPPFVPIVSAFFGIVVRLFHDDHPPAHMHVEYAEHSAVIDIATGRVLGGHLPPRVRRLAEEWRRARRVELHKAWLEAQAGKQPRRIPPLE